MMRRWRNHGSPHTCLVDALAPDAEPGGDVSVSLARTATWLLDLPGRDPLHPAAPVPSESVTNGRVTTARPALPGHDDYTHPARALGADEPSWRGPVRR